MYFVFEGFSPDGLSALARAFCVSPLDHEAGYVSVEGGPVVLGRRRQSQKVLARLRALLAKQLALQITQVRMHCQRHSSTNKILNRAKLVFVDQIV